MKYLAIIIIMFYCISCSNTMSERPLIPIPLKNHPIHLGDSYAKIAESIPIQEELERGRKRNTVNFDHDAKDWTLAFTTDGARPTFHPVIMTADFDDQALLLQYTIHWGSPDLNLKDASQMQKAIDLISEAQLELRHRFELPDRIDLPLVKTLHFDHHFEKLSLSEYTIHYTTAYKEYPLDD